MLPDAATAIRAALDELVAHQERLISELRAVGAPSADVHAQVERLQGMRAAWACARAAHEDNERLQGMRARAALATATAGPCCDTPGHEARPRVVHCRDCDRHMCDECNRRHRCGRSDA